MIDKKTLLLAIDPGYGGIKIVVIFDNYVANYDFPSQITTPKESHKGLSLAQNGFYITVENGSTYLFGDAAENTLISNTSVDDNIDLLDVNKSCERFRSINFKYELEASIASSLRLFENSSDGQQSGFSIDELNDYNIYVGVALPHDNLESDGPTVASYIKCEHSYEYYVAGKMNAPKHLKYDFTSVPVFINSQAILAFCSFAMDDQGNDIPNLIDYLPCIVYDAGWKTVGRFALTLNKELCDAESNMDYAMYNAYEATINRINNTTDGHFKAFQVPVFIKYGRSFKNGVHIIDPKPIFEDEFYKLSLRAANELMDDWTGHINESESLLLAGGTGAAYRETFKNEISKKHPGLRIESANSTYRGVVMEPIFAIAVGLVKYMLSIIGKEA